MSSTVDLRVELPSYSHTFTVLVSSSCTVLDVKDEIRRRCPGAPRVDGQRIVWRGRFLNDGEKVEDIWKSDEDSKIVHLSVHPSAWTGKPPNSVPAPGPKPTEQPQQPTLIPQRAEQRQQPTPTPTVQPQYIPAPTQSFSFVPIYANHPMAYIKYRHQQAVMALTHSSAEQTSEPGAMDFARALGIAMLEAQGYSWPAILDEPFPMRTPGGVKYVRTIINGQAFLKLTNEGVTPTPAQAHALKVMTYTLVLLHLPVPEVALPPPPSPTSLPLPPEAHIFLQQLHNNNNNNQPNGGVGIPVLEIRPLLAPLLMLLFRTVLLLYFVSPARKPIFGLLILAWVMYEIWRPINNALQGLRRVEEQIIARRRDEGQRNDNNNNNNNNNNGEDRRPRDGNDNNNNQLLAGGTPDAIDFLGAINIDAEERALADPQNALVNEPTLSAKVAHFATLLLGTVHPAVWNRRRTVLGRREGRIRMEASARENNGGQEEESDERRRRREELIAQHARRPVWVRDYIRRVVAADWVDDSD